MGSLRPTDFMQAVWPVEELSAEDFSEYTLKQVDDGDVEKLRERYELVEQRVSEDDLRKVCFILSKSCPTRSFL